LSKYFLFLPPIHRFRTGIPTSYIELHIGCNDGVRYTCNKVCLKTILFLHVLALGNISNEHGGSSMTVVLSDDWVDTRYEPALSAKDLQSILDDLRMTADHHPLHGFGERATVFLS
jgi:hypothetical protein